MFGKLTRTKTSKKLPRINVLIILLIINLISISFQDFKSRSVYWFWFPVLICLFVIKNYFENGQAQINQKENILINLAFLFVQLLLVSLYFAIKHRQWVNITRDLLGWGDVLLLISIAFYLSPLNYIVFYVLSLILICSSWVIITLLFKKINKQIPLAGLQSVILIVFLVADWLLPSIDLTNDNWLLHYLL